MRKNPLGIQLLSKSIFDRVFPNPKSLCKDKSSLLQISKEHLKRHSLLGRKCSIVPDIENMVIPELKGSDLKNHFSGIATQSYHKYLEFARLLQNVNQPIRPLKENWIKRAGWTRYSTSKDGRMLVEPVSVPLENSLIFDCEVMMSDGKYPTLATAMSDQAWYCWVSPKVINPKDNSNYLIPFDSEEKLIVGHNVSFDRARILNEYDINGTKLRFLDTMSMHIALNGMCTTQRYTYLKIDKELKSNIADPTHYLDFDHRDLDWFSLTTTNSLASVSKFYLNEELDKDARSIFTKGNMNDLNDINTFQDAVDYCAKDVDITHRIFKKIFPLFFDDKLAGNMFSFGGTLEMGSCILPVTPKWDQFLSNAETVYQQQMSHVVKGLQNLAKEALNSDNAARQTDHYLKQLDWTPKGRKKLPSWYHSLIPSGQTEPELTTRTRATVLLLRMTWLGYPLYYLGTSCGWCFRVPRHDEIKMRSFKKVELKELENGVLEKKKRMKVNSKSENSEIRYRDLFANDSDGLYYRLPAEKNKTNSNKNKDANCGSPLAKKFLNYIMDGTLGTYGANPLAKEVIEANISCSYWISARSRLMEQFVVPANDALEQKNSSSDLYEVPFGIIIPGVVVAGTVTRRAVEGTWMCASNAKKKKIGSELKSQVIAPPGYKIVGADVDSQELWIAGLYGDAQFGMHGATAFGWMTLQGSKAEGTDLHSRSAQILKSTRDHAKIFNYARIYGSGIRFASDLLRKCDASISEPESVQRSQSLYLNTKGNRFYNSINELRTLRLNSEIRKKLSVPFWYGGSESYMFNALEEIASSEDPRLPASGVQLPGSLVSPTARRKYMTSCVNWVVQSSGVDYLHLLLTSMKFLTEQYNIKARLLVTIHDEIRYLVKDEDVDRAVLALQISNLWTRCLFAESVGMDDLPMSVAFFSGVDVDNVLRKEVNDPCITPSSPEGIKENGVTYSIYETLKRVQRLGDTTNPIPEPEIKRSASKIPEPEMKRSASNSKYSTSNAKSLHELWLRLQMCSNSKEMSDILTRRK